jgi:hypothetical protein
MAITDPKRNFAKKLTDVRFRGFSRQTKARRTAPISELPIALEILARDPRKFAWVCFALLQNEVTFYPKCGQEGCALKWNLYSKMQSDRSVAMTLPR